MKEYLEKSEIMDIIDNTLRLTDIEYDAIWKNVKYADSVTFDEEQEDSGMSNVAHWIESTESVGCKSLGTIEVPTYTCTHCRATVGPDSIGPFCPECGYFMIAPDDISFLDDDDDDDDDDDYGYYTTSTIENETDLDLEKKETYTLEEILDAIVKIWDGSDADSDSEPKEVKNCDEDSNDNCDSNDLSDNSIDFPTFKTLSDTIYFMNSDSYKDRLIAEYYQAKIRYTGLINMLKKWDNDELNFVPTCPKSLLEFQASTMKRYLMVLESRASIENIVLDVD